VVSDFLNIFESLNFYDYLIL